MYGKHLKELREAKKLSQDQVAQELNVSRQAISKWENDKTFPDIDNLIRLSRLYGVTLDELVGVEREKEETTEKDKEEEKNGCSNQSILGWVMIAVAVCSCWISPVGIVASLIILYKSREINFEKMEMACKGSRAYNYGGQHSWKLYHTDRYVLGRARIGRISWVG